MVMAEEKMRQETQVMAEAVSHKIMNTIQVRPTGGRDYDWSHEKPYHWTEDAACVFLPDTMFEIASPGSKIAEGLTDQETKDLNIDNFTSAEKACAKCPVWHMCYQEAELEDFRWTMRAGFWPIAFNPESVGRPRKAAPEARQKIDPTQPCKNGHEATEWRQRSDQKGYYCASCKAEGRGRKPNSQWRIDPEKPCRNGHPPEWGINSKGYYFCRECERERSRARKRKP